MIRLSQCLRAWICRSQHLPGIVSRGISLIESLVVLSILGVLIAIASPSLSDIIRNGRLSSQNSQMLYSLNLARSEAVKRMLPVVVCRGSTTAGCDGAGAWEGGWIVFADLNGDGNYAAGDELLEVNGGLYSGFTLHSTPSIPGFVRFDANGGSSVSSVDSRFILCKDGREDWARFVIVTPAGRIRRGIDNTEINSCTPDPL